MDKPLLYLSYFFKAHRTEYYARLNAVRMRGEWEEWIKFFLRGVEATATVASNIAREIFQLHEADRERLRTSAAQKTALMAFEHFCKHPTASVGSVSKQLNMNYPRAQRAVDSLLAAGILQEQTGKLRGRQFVYLAYFDILKRDTILPMG